MKLAILFGGPAAMAAGLVVAGPAQAQAQRGIAEIVVFGTDPCPRSSDDRIVVCRRLDERYRYRMPEAYRPDGSFQEKQSWAQQAKSLETVGRTGINSCSPVGPGGHTGCLTQVIQRAQEQRKALADEDTPPQ